MRAAFDHLDVPGHQPDAVGVDAARGRVDNGAGHRIGARLVERRRQRTARTGRPPAPPPNSACPRYARSTWISVPCRRPPSGSGNQPQGMFHRALEGKQQVRRGIVVDPLRIIAEKAFRLARLPVPPRPQVARRPRHRARWRPAGCPSRAITEIVIAATFAVPRRRRRRSARRWRRASAGRGRQGPGSSAGAVRRGAMVRRRPPSGRESHEGRCGRLEDDVDQGDRGARSAKLGEQVAAAARSTRVAMRAGRRRPGGGAVRGTRGVA